MTLTSFLKARDELLALLEPFAVDYIEKALGKEYDVSKLITFVHTNVRAFLEEGSIILFDACSQLHKMKARSILIDRDRQVKTFGRVAIDDEAKATEFIEAVGPDGPLLEAVRKLDQTGDRNALRQVRDPYVRGKFAGKEAAEDVVRRIGKIQHAVRRRSW